MTSASVAGIVPQPLHLNRPPQSPVWQWPTPWLLNEQPVRPQNRVFRLFGVLIVTLCPGRSVQPVVASGVLGLGAAATQIVCDISLTNVTLRRGALATAALTDEAAAEEVPAEEVAADEIAADEIAADEIAADEIAADGVATREAVAESGRGDKDAGVPVIRTTVGEEAAAPVSADVPLPASCVALTAPPAAAQPAAAVTAASTAAVPIALAISALVSRLGRRLPFPLNITGILPCVGSLPLSETNAGVGE